MVNTNSSPCTKCHKIETCFMECQRQQEYIKKQKARVKLNDGKVHSKTQLAEETGLNDRAMRNEIRKMREAGIPVVPMEQGGYKIAQTDAERERLLKQYRGRALSLLRTYNRLLKEWQVPGQLSMRDILIELAREAEA